METALAVSFVEECATCLGILARNPGAKIVLCRDCKRNTLPREYGNPLQSLIGYGHFRPDPELEPSAAARKAMRRNERRARIIQPKGEPDAMLTPHFCVRCSSEPVTRAGLMCGPCGADAQMYRAAHESLFDDPEAEFGEDD